MATRIRRLLIALVVGLGVTLAIGLTLSARREARAESPAAFKAALERQKGPMKAARLTQPAVGVPNGLSAAAWESILAQVGHAPRPVRQTAKITAADGDSNDRFGGAVAVDGDTLVAGAYTDEDNGYHSGSVYIFARNEGGADSWGQTAKITATDGDMNDRFGYAVAVDGDTLVVGAIGDEDNGDISGSAYVFTRNEGGADNWGLTAKITATDGITDDHFGCAVAVHDDTVVIGALYDDTFGSAYVFTRNEGGADNWGLTAKITATNGIKGAYFGHAVAVHDDTAIIGALYDDDNGAYSGSAYVFARNEGGADSWGQTAKITATDGITDDMFGKAVAVSGDTVVVGAPSAGESGSAGSAYIFTGNEGGADSWNQTAKITATDGAIGDEFGSAVAIHGDTVVVGADHDSDNGEYSGSAYLFNRNQGGADNWGQVAKITASDSEARDHFGEAVTLDGDTVVVGAPDDDDNDGTSGSAYLFTRLGNNWEQESHPAAPDGETSDQFGHAVAVDGDTAVVGAPYDDAQGTQSGSAYVFTRNQGGADEWGLTAHLSATDGATYDHFGYAVGVNGDTVVVGATGDDASGSAYVFTRNEGGADAWGQTAKITATDGTGGEGFGYAVGVSGDTVVVGAPSDNPQGSYSGSAYVFAQNKGGADNWGQTAKISPTLGMPGAYFGQAVAIDGDTAIVGAPYHNTDYGVAYVFERNRGGLDQWGQVCDKHSPASGAEFGTSVDIDGGTAVVGAPGTARFYVFRQNQNGADQWGHVRTRLGTSSTGFGRSVAVGGDTLVVGAYSADVAVSNAGAAHVYKRNEGGPDNWGRITGIEADDAATLDAFGWAVATDGDVILVGAYNDDSGTGSAYVFREGPFAVYLPLVLRSYP